MDDVNAYNFALLVLRVAIGSVMIAHGYRHIYGGGKIEGTAGWFESLGMRPGIVHAWIASLTELAGGACLVLGFLTPFGGAAVIGTMTVALVSNHWRNGFFIFNKGEGYEYVMTLIAAGLVLAVAWPGEWSLDHQLELELAGNTGLVIALLAGGGGAASLLGLFWRPEHDGDG